MNNSTSCHGHDLPLSHAEALNLLRVVSDAVTDFMSAYPGPESCRLVQALTTANKLVGATAPCTALPGLAA